MLDHTTSIVPDHDALVFHDTVMSWGEVGHAVAQTAEALRRVGVEKGDRVALILPNAPQHLICFYAILRLGAIGVEHNPTLTPNEIHTMFANHQAKVAITVTPLVPVLAPLGLDAIFTIDGADAVADNVITWPQVLQTQPLDPNHPRPTPDDIAILQYTSGTTGVPKGAMLTHHNLRSNIEQIKAWLVGAEPCRETLYGVLPMFHIFGLTTSLGCSVSLQMRLVIFAELDPAALLSAVQKYPPTFLVAVPPMLEGIARAAAAYGVKIPTLRFCVSGAMPLPETTVENWNATTGSTLVEAYGLTETSPAATITPFGRARKPGTIGLFVPSTQARVVQVENPDVDVEIGEPGELLLKGPQVFTGYWNNPEETAKTLLPGGWLRTGDVVTMDDEGFVTIVDRVKDLIISGGFNVAPTEVEDVVRQHPDIADVVVFGRPVKPAGEQVMAAVILNEGATLDILGLREFCRQKLAPYKIPARIVAVDSLPRTALGKVQRRLAREQLLGSGSSLISHD